MTKKLFNPILAICLLFSSLYLPAHAETANKTPSSKPIAQAKKSPATTYLDGATCLKQADIACAKLALANIPGISPYAKLLQGSIALAEKQTDKALLLLLPLQTEENLIPPAKIALHQHLAEAFEYLDDVQQAIQHLIQAEAVSISSKAIEPTIEITAAHEKIWGLLSKLEQPELIELRGNNTDNTFQGWVDLRLAAINQNLNSSIADWSMLYPDHPAQSYAKKLAAANTAQAEQPVHLSSAGSIALILPLSTETALAKAEAFKLGLEAALAKHQLQNEIKSYPSAENQLDIAESLTLAQNEDNAYFIRPNFNTDTESKIERHDAQSILHISPTLGDEVQHIINFALNRGMQKIMIINADDETSKHMATRFETAWKNSSGDSNNDDSLTIIMLPDNLSVTDNRLLELKSQIVAKPHDMIVLAMQAPMARLVRPQLPISTPTLTFSNANEILEDTNYHPLNAVRLFEIPYLLNSKQPAYLDYQTEDASLNSNELLRWFALGVDSLQLLIASEDQSGREVSISGLSGKLIVNKSGAIKRDLPLAIFTHDGLVTEQ